MKPTYVLDFYPPMKGLEGEFNTFRLGKKWATRLKKGSKVLLVDSKENILIGKAKVIEVHLGTLEDMLLKHAHNNHNWCHLKAGDAIDALYASLKKRYGPHIATVTKPTSVIYLKS